MNEQLTEGKKEFTIPQSDIVTASDIMNTTPHIKCYIDKNINKIVEDFHGEFMYCSLGKHQDKKKALRSRLILYCNIMLKDITSDEFARICKLLRAHGRTEKPSDSAAKYVLIYIINK